MTDDLIEDGLAAAFGPDRDSSLTGLSRFCLAQGIESRLSLPEPVGETTEQAPIAFPGRPGTDASLAGRYRLTGEIARGGMGRILRGHDPDLGRDVAIKVLHPDLAKKPDVLERFVEEAQIGGQLQHPGIVPVYEVGLTEDQPFFAMKLIRGETLAALLQERKSPTENRPRLLEVFQAVCRTMAYAHARSVLHRDLKPANILVGAFGEVQIVDWGLAKVLSRGGVADERKRRGDREGSQIETVRNRPDASGSESLVGSVLGTPAYMPPEQARGDIEHLDERSDVFSLGAILCEILTGAPPYASDTDADDTLVLASRGDTSPALHRLREAVADPELVRLCEECLTPARQARPRNAQALADRITAHLEAAEERAQTAELRAASSRYRQRTTLIASVATLLLITLGAVALLWNQGQRQTRQAEATRLANIALTDARSIQVEAESDPTQLTVWDRAVASTTAASRLASAPDVDPDLVTRVEDLLSAVSLGREQAIRDADQRSRDQRMLEALKEARTPDDSGFRIDNRAFSSNENRRQRTNYSKRFAEYLGFVVGQETSERTVDSLEDSAIRQAAVDGFDHWSLLTSIRLLWVTQGSEEPDPEVQRAVDRLRDEVELLRTIASRLDRQNSWRRRLRAATDDLDASADTLGKLADQIDAQSATPTDFRLLADALRAVEKQDQALELLRIGIESHPQDFELHVRLAIEEHQASFRRDDPDAARERAINVLRIAHALRPESVQVALRIGLLHLLQTGNPVEADREGLRWLERAHEMDPQNRQAAIAWGSQLIGRERFDEVDALFERLGDRIEQDPDLLVLRSAVRQRRGQSTEADQDTLKAYALAPDDANIASSFTEFCIRKGRTAEATRISDRINASGRIDFGRSVYRAQGHYYEGDFEGALRFFQGPAAKLIGKDVAARGEAVQLVALKRFAEALEAARRSGLFRDDMTALCAIGEELWLDGFLEEARRAWKIVRNQTVDVAWLDFLQDRDLRIESILSGDEMTVSDQEWRVVVDILGRQRRYREMRGFVERTITESAEGLAALNDDALLEVAVLAAIASRSEAVQQTEEERREMGALSRRWLKALLDRAQRAASDEGRQLLRQCLTAPDFHFVRSPAALESLEPPQRESWLALWEEIRSAEDENR